SDDRSHQPPRPKQSQSGRQNQPAHQIGHGQQPREGQKGDKLGDRHSPTKGSQPNEGEGNRTAAREYNRRTERFARSGQVEKKAREAQEAVDGEEGEELARAEAEGKSHSAGDDRARKPD